MDTGDQKTVYTALSNSVIGVMLLIGGAAGWLADIAGPETVLAVFAAFAMASVPVSLSLSEVQDTGES
jgi:acyl-CoA synthetase (AMP-forming)/AMP-acid ligase II